MSWDEALFGWAYGKTRRWRKPRVPVEVLARQALLEPLRDRLRVLACALLGGAAEISEAEREGGFAGSAILLPRAMDFAPTVADNEDAFVLRVAWSVAAMLRGLALAQPAEDPVERWLATLLAAPATRDALLELCPGAEERLAALGLAASEALGLPEPGAARALVTLARVRLGDLRPVSLDARSERWLARALAAHPQSREALASSVADLLPELRSLRNARSVLPAAPALWGWVGTGVAAALGPTAGAHEAEALPSGTELRGRPRENVRRVELPEDAAQDNPFVHSFEKVHTAEEHRGGSKNADGSDELEDHAAALDEIDMREVIRSTERTSGLLMCDAVIEGAAGDLMDDALPPGDGIAYDEWNQSTGAYRPEWCRVRVGAVAAHVSPADASAFATSLRVRGARHVQAVRAELERVELERRWRGRQLDGPSIDEDAVVERFGMLAAGHSGTERLYRSRRRSAPGLTVLLLIDGSLSTDAWIAGRRVLDVELESAHVIAEALDGLEIELAIATFHSHTRRDCRFVVVKDVHEPWSAARLRLASIRPFGYTRIGPALRHATAVLGRSESRRRLLLVLTDGKPNDYDRYEGSYGVADVRQAVREAARDGVHVHALAIDPRARMHLSNMLGAGAHSVVTRPDDLALAMGRVCAAMGR